MAGAGDSFIDDKTLLSGRDIVLSAVARGVPRTPVVARMRLSRPGADVDRDRSPTTFEEALAAAVGQRQIIVIAATRDPIRAQIGK